MSARGGQSDARNRSSSEHWTSSAFLTVRWTAARMLAPDSRLDALDSGSSKGTKITLSLQTQVLLKMAHTGLEGR
jgi:hypothetical protein